MSINTEQVELLTASFRRIEGELEEVVAGFYTRLFDVAPHLQSYFHGDLNQQKRQMFSTLLMISQNLPYLQRLRKPLLEMGRVHSGHGIKEEYFPIVRDALVYAIAQASGESWTAQHKIDWTDALDEVSSYMIEGMRDAQAKAA